MLVFNLLKKVESLRIAVADKIFLQRRVSANTANEIANTASSKYGILLNAPICIKQKKISNVIHKNK